MLLKSSNPFTYNTQFNDGRYTYLDKNGAMYSGRYFCKFINMNLKLTRPLVFFDVETTGVSIANDRICQLSFIKFFPQEPGKPPVDAVTKTKLINPGIPISPEATEIHKITNDMVKDEPLFEEYAQSIYKQFDGCDLGGYNVLRFDIPILREHFLRCKINWHVRDVRIIDAFVLIQRGIPRDLSSIYTMMTGNAPEQAHDAEYDNMMCIEVISKLLDHDREFNVNPNKVLNHPESIDDLWELVKPDEKFADYARKIKIDDKSGEYVYNFGKHQGEPVKHYRQFAKWMITADFPEDTKRVLLDIFNVQRGADI